ncbi:MAG: DUF4040 domain-containing protein, partial [Bacteroidales bacterium]|nr:DUF4040 domain-containing protein [Bacteroidales bacterium]
LFNDLFLIGPGILAVFSLGMGLFPNTLTALVEPALSVVQAESIEIKLKLWHGFNEVLMLSIFTVLTGVVLFYIIHTKYNWLLQWRKINGKIFGVRFTDVFARIVEIFTAFSAKNTRIIQHGYHRYYLLTVLIVAMLLLGVQLYFTRGWELDATFSWQPFYASVLILFVVAATVFSTLSRSRLATVIAMGVVGYGISLIYLYYSAVDLAITQIVVETLSLVMFVIVLQKLPRFARLSKKRTRLRDALIALSFGGVMTMLALKAIHVDLNHPVSDYFIENSYLGAFGKNVVNVILVDFRALDTLGEVTVLAIAALGVWVLLQPKKIKP